MAFQILICAGLVAFSFLAGAAEPFSSQNRCATAYEQTQRTRKAGRLQQALSEAIACAQPQCAKLLQVDCSRWMDELREALPTVVVDVRTEDDQAVSNARVFVDEQPLDAALRGRAVTLDPGVHTLRVEALGQSVSQRFVAVEGRKRQILAVQLAKPTRPLASPVASGTTDPRMSSRKKTALALAVVATTAVASWGYFGLHGLNRRDELERTCGGSCPAADRAAIETTFLVADLSLLVAAVSGGAAAWLWLNERKQHEVSGISMPRVQVSASTQSAWVGLTGTF